MQKETDQHMQDVCRSDGSSERCFEIREIPDKEAAVKDLGERESGKTRACEVLSRDLKEELLHECQDRLQRLCLCFVCTAEIWPSWDLLLYVLYLSLEIFTLPFTFLKVWFVFLNLQSDCVIKAEETGHLAIVSLLRSSFTPIFPINPPRGYIKRRRPSWRLGAHHIVTLHVAAC